MTKIKMLFLDIKVFRYKNKVNYVRISSSYHHKQSTTDSPHSGMISQKQLQQGDISTVNTESL